MGKYHHNSIFQYLLVLCLSLVLLLAQTNRLHMHLEHDSHSDTSGHVVDVHSASMLHDFELTHHDGLNNDHHPAAIDVSSDNLITKSNLLNPLVLILLFAGLFLALPRLVCRLRHSSYKILFTLRYYLLHPPLRAPPAK